MLEDVTCDLAALVRALRPQGETEKNIRAVLERCLRDLHAAAAQAAREERPTGRPVPLRSV